MGTVATRCVVEPPNGVLVTTARARPRAVVGASKLTVVSRARNGSWPSGMENPVGIHTLVFPLGSAPSVTVVGPTASSTYLNWANAERLGDAVMLEQCGFESNLANVACHLEALDPAATARPVGLGVPRLEMDGSARFTVARSGETFLALLAYRGADLNGVRAYRWTGAGAPQSVRVGPGSGQIDPRDDEQLALRVEPRPDGGASLEVGFPRSGRTTRYAFAADGTVSPGESVSARTEAAGPVIDFRPVDGQPQHLRIAGPTPRLIEGLDEAVATFAPSVATHQAGTTLVWSEGLDDTTRIRLARVDVAAARLAGPVVDVSTTGHEAGFATVDTFGEHTVVTWDEKNGRLWEVRAAEVRCSP